MLRTLHSSRAGPSQMTLASPCTLRSTPPRPRQEQISGAGEMMRQPTAMALLPSGGIKLVSGCPNLLLIHLAPAGWLSCHHSFIPATHAAPTQGRAGRPAD